MISLAHTLYYGILASSQSAYSKNAVSTNVCSGYRFINDSIIDSG